jgi:hypothetical protein
VVNNKNPNQKQPGEKDQGTFHYNSGNMSGKIGSDKDADPRQPNAEKEQQNRTAKSEG